MRVGVGDGIGVGEGVGVGVGDDVGVDLGCCVVFFCGFVGSDVGEGEAVSIISHKAGRTP